jgi:outer membrane biosynthesis protein TonB
MSLNNLISKVLAAGLAAGVFLIWWPAHLPSTGVEWLVLRGLAWTLAFEILVLSFCPLENIATRAMTRRRSAVQARRMRGLLADAPAQAKASGAVVLAFTGLLLPGLMLAHAGHLPAKRAPRPVQVVRKVVVRKVVKKTVVVHAPATVVQAPAPTPTAPVATAAPAATEKAATKKTPEKTATTVTKAAPKKAPTTTTADPVNPTTLPDPAEAATPSAGATTPTADAG